MDVKSGLTKNLNSILKPEDSFLLSHWGSEYQGWGQYPELKGKPEFQNWFIIKEPEHPFLAATIGDVEKTFWTIRQKSLVQVKTALFGRLGRFHILK